MNRHDKYNARHGHDKYIVLGAFITLIILGGAMAWLTRLSPTVSTEPGTAGNLSATSSVSGTSSSVVPASGSLSGEQVASLARFLRDQKITMYGAEWCPHCQDQKDAFGAAWQDVPYVECPDNPRVCLTQGIEGYPTWKKSTGEKLEGFTPLEDLALWAGFEI